MPEVHEHGVLPPPNPSAPAPREHSPERFVERSHEHSPERSSPLDPDLPESAGERRRRVERLLVRLATLRVHVRAAPLKHPFDTWRSFPFGRKQIHQPSYRPITNSAHA
jgi:hypothetical protein